VLNEALGGSIATMRKLWRFHQTVGIFCLDARVLFATSGEFSSRAVRILFQTQSWPNKFASPVTRCRQLSWACARIPGRNCKHITKRVCFSPQVSAWGPRRKFFRV
jgi:hypothetical protein